jgi:hypothetical protein
MKYTLLFLALIILSCNNKNKKTDTEQIVKPIIIDTKKADYLYTFAYTCIDQEYPNKLGQVLGDSTYLKSPKELHPTFYGCFDWHSAVHGHWTLVNILNTYPDFKEKDEIIKKLQATISKENILKEIEYFDDVHNKTFERTYGWAWLLKLAKSLKESNIPELKALDKNLEPLTQLIESKCIEFFKKLNYPIRVGEHPNTAFGMSFALDYAENYSLELAKVIKERAKVFYQNDEGCPINWEPGGFDFLSPCLEEATLMLKVLPKEDYLTWLDQFLPGFRTQPSQYIYPVEVVDKTDGKMAHLDGLNFSRTWCLYQIGKALNNNKMIALANTHFNDSYSKMDTGEYAGAHWLASFALHALKTGQ